MDLAGRTAVVTGGASGIGAAAYAQLCDAGAKVAIWDLQPPEGHFRCDVADPASVASAAAATVDRLGVPSLLVTAAGIGGFAPIESASLDEWRRVLDVNLVGTMLCLQAFARAVGADASGAPADGSVVCVSSINASIPTAGMSAYCTSKAAVEMLAKVAAAELGPHGVRVNVVAPGITETPLFADSAGRLDGFREAIGGRTPLGRVGSADDVATAIVALLRTEWVTGEVVRADGGLSLASPYDFM